MTKTKYPLYSGEMCGASYDDKGKRYEMVIITQWSSCAKNATEVQHKAYYFEQSKGLSKTLDNENYCRQIFSYPQYSKLKIREEIKITQC